MNPITIIHGTGAPGCLPWLAPPALSFSYVLRPEFLVWSGSPVRLRRKIFFSQKTRHAHHARRTAASSARRPPNKHLSPQLRVHTHKCAYVLPNSPNSRECVTHVVKVAVTTDLRNP